ncbi:MAG: NAD(P)/FAD-dependent oxidoreductase [Rhodothermales bacterium]
MKQSKQASQLSVAIVGAGFTGLNAGRTLMDQGIKVRLFDKSRGAGGRMASRRTDTAIFDHGAQYFTVRDARFQPYVEAWNEAGLVQPWEGKLGTIEAGAINEGKIKPSSTRIKRYVGTPRMSALTRHLSTGLDIQFKTRIQCMERVDNQWRLTDTEGTDLGTYDVVLITTPPSQAVPLLTEAPELAGQIENVSMSPTWAVMVAFAHRLNIAYDGLFFNDAPLSWAARNSSKPERGAQESWVLHGSAGWSAEHLEAGKEDIADQLLAHFFERTQLEAISPTHLQAHRWRFALANAPLNAGCLWDEELRVGVCGDWCMQSRVEGAFLSGMAGAGRVLSLAGESASQPIGLQASLF